MSWPSLAAMPTRRLGCENRGWRARAYAASAQKHGLKPGKWKHGNGLMGKHGTKNRNPGKWKHGLKPAVQFLVV